MALSAIAETQTDARCYLASILSRPTKVTVEGDERGLRLVGNEHDIFEGSYGQYQVEFWDDQHGIAGGDGVKLELPGEKLGTLILTHVLEGTVTRVKGPKVFISGSEALLSES